MEKRYQALRTIGTIYRVLGIIILVLTIIAAVAFCVISVIGGTTANSLSQIDSRAGIFGGIFIGIGIIIYGGLISLSLIAFGEGIYLLISIEENTRKTAYIIENQNKLPPSDNQAKLTP